MHTEIGLGLTSTKAATQDTCAQRQIASKNIANPMSYDMHVNLWVNTSPILCTNKAWFCEEAVAAPGRPNKRLHFALVFKGPKLGPQNQPFKDNPINHWKPQPKWSRLGVPFWSHATHASSCVSLGHSNSTNDKNKPQMFSSHMHMVRAKVTQHGHPMANLLLPQAICFDSLQLVLDNKAVTTPCEPSHEQFN